MLCRVIFCFAECKAVIFCYCWLQHPNTLMSVLTHRLGCVTMSCTPSCTCHPWLLNGHCVASSEHQACVSFSSLLKYNHLEVVPLSDAVVKGIWKKAFPRHSTTGHYPSWKRFQDMFDDSGTKPMNEARLSVAFMKLNNE